MDWTQILLSIIPALITGLIAILKNRFDLKKFSAANKAEIEKLRNAGFSIDMED
jgi:hypothetical protein